MKLFSFKGGIHPSEFKELTSDKEIEDLPLPKKVVIPLHQHAGQIAKPIVSVNDYVKKGQKIGIAEGFISSNVHATISGKVVEIKPYPHPLGKQVPSIIIESDGKDEWIEVSQSFKEYFRLLPQEIRNIIQEAGIVGLGGAAFPTHVKLTPPKDKIINAVIINGCECEPYLTCDYQLMLKYSKEIIQGLKIIMKALDTSKGFIGIEKNKPLALQKMVNEAAKEPNIEVLALKTKYPQGAEKQLIKAILKKEVPPGGLPLDVGCVVHNVGTALAVRDAIVKGHPLVERIITVTGKGIKTPRNLRVRMGTLFSEVIEQCGGYASEPGKIIMGGPMMGLAQDTDAVPVIKGTSGILVLSKEEIDDREESSCIKCCKCISACPVNLLPNMIVLYARNRIWDKTGVYNVDDCIECGCCAYVCPAKIPLVKYIKEAKVKVALRKKGKTIVKKG